MTILAASSYPMAERLKGSKVKGAASLHEVMQQMRTALGEQMPVDAHIARSGLLSDRFSG